MKKKLKVLFISVATLILMIGGFSAIKTFAYNIGTAYGWYWTGGPSINTPNSWITNSIRGSGYDINNRIRNSKSFTFRMPKIQNLGWTQTRVFDPNFSTYVNFWTNYTYITQAESGYVDGYANWYDTQYGLALDYIGAFANSHDSSVPPDSDPVSWSAENDLIEYNDFLFPGSVSTAFVGSANSEALSDLKSAALYQDNNPYFNYPIYASGHNADVAASTTSISPALADKLRNKGVKNLIMLGGYSRFDFTAGFNSGFNIIRAGGLNTQETYNYMTTLPREVLTPTSYTPDTEGIVIEGSLPNGADWYRNQVYNELVKFRDTGNIVYLTDLAKTMSASYNIGPDPVDWAAATKQFTIGIHTPTMESYWTCYYNNTRGWYIYNLVLPGYFPKSPPVVYDQIRMTMWDYRDYVGKYWIKKGNKFEVVTDSFMEKSTGAYPDQTKLLIAKEGNFNYGSYASVSTLFRTTLEGVGAYTQFSPVDNSRVAYRYIDNFVNLAFNHSYYGLEHGNYTLYPQGVYYYDENWVYGRYWIEGTASDYEIQLGVDGEGPKSDWTTATKFTDSNTIHIMQQGIYDEGSGVNLEPYGVYAMVYPKGSSDYGGGIFMYKNPDYYDFSATVYLPSHYNGSTATEWNVDIYASDNVGNKSLLSSQTYTRPGSEPISVSTEIRDYEYKEESRMIKWVRPDDEFTVLQSGYVDYGYPTNSYILMNPIDHLDWILLGSKMGVNSYWNWEMNNPNIWRSTNNYLRFEKTGNLGYGIADHKFTVNSALHAQVYRVQGTTELVNNIYDKSGEWISDPYRLGIDAKGPVLSYVKNGRRTVALTAIDNESGLNKIEVWGNMIAYSYSNSSPYTVDLANSTDSTITATDNVGYKTDLKIGDVMTVITPTITTTPVTQNGRRYLKVDVALSIKNPVPGQILDVKVKGDGDGVPVIEGSNVMWYERLPAGSTSFTHSFLIDDVYNQSSGPNLSYSNDILFTAKVDITNIEDLLKNYTFSVETKYESDPIPIVEASKSTTFMSGRKHYDYKLYQTKDEFGVAMSDKLITSSTTTGNSVDLSDLYNGTYYMKVIMYDNNGNPSGESRVDFTHITPFSHTKLDLQVTAVKDLTWEKEVYPITYSTSKFPLGSKYKFNNNPIKLGYGFNFNVKVPLGHYADGYRVSYEITGSSGQALTGYSNDVELSIIDRNEGSNYLTQPNNFIVENERLYLKHFLPANGVFKTTTGTIYKGDVTVTAKITMTRSTATTSINIPLYTVTTEATAFDDLYLDKQR